MLTLRIESTRTKLSGFRYWWLKRVLGFNSAVHCAKCLIGDYEPTMSPTLDTNTNMELDGYLEGDVVYLCGVSSPYRWERNFHLAGVVKRGEIAVGELYTGDVVRLFGVRAVEFDGDRAAELFGKRGPEFLTCRNFQFGAHFFSPKTLENEQKTVEKSA